MQLRLKSSQFLRLALCVIGLVLAGQYSYADNAILKRSLMAWQEYEGLRISGTAKRYVEKSAVEQIAFQLNIARGERGQPGAMELGHRIRNPGEPHLDDDYLFKTVWAQSPSLTIMYRRSFVSEVLSNKRSHAILSSAKIFDEPYSTIMRSVVCDLSGECPRASFSNLSYVLAHNRTEVLGSEEILGIKASRVVVSPINSGANSAPKMEALVALEPTFQVLQFAKQKGSMDEEGMPVTLLREVESVRNFGGKLFCDRVWNYASDGGRWLVEIEDVKDLPTDYVGLWEINRLTGVDFLGELEQATRKGSPRVPSAYSKEVSYIPFTHEEDEAIRRYLMNKVAVVRPRVNWFKVLLWTVNITAVLVLAYVGYRRMRFGA